MIKYEQKVVTPEEAREMLGTMVKNRRISPLRLKVLKESMQSGNFKECPNPICFNKNGELIDGQHRLSAIMETGIPQLMTIARNVAEDAMIDRGMERSMSSSLYMRGVVDKEVSKAPFVSIARLYFLLVHGDSYPSENAVEIFIHENRENLLKAVEITSHNSTFTGKVGVKFAVYDALKAGESEEKIKRFVSCLNTGFMNGESETSAITLRNYIINHPKVGVAARKDLVSVSEQAINDFVQAKPRRRYYVVGKYIYCTPYRKEILDG